MTLKDKIKLNKAKIGIFGLGYVGLPLACGFADAGFDTIGLEIDKTKVDSINRGRSYISDIKSEIIASLVRKNKLSATSDFSNIRNLDVVIICVPTPLSKSKDPDVSYILNAANQISKHFGIAKLIVLESTSFPGTTRELIIPILEEKKLKIGKNFHLAFSPERIDPGNRNFGLRNTPKVVGGITSQCTEIAALLYSKIVNKVIPVSSSEAAEMTKLLENTFRAVNIGLVNEIALICNRLNLDVWEIINAAATKPFGFMPFYPGPGLGGHCIPIDPLYLSWKLKTLNFYARFIELAGEINSKMPEFVVDKLSNILNSRKKCIAGSKILVLGIAYKKDVSDMRESPALDVISILESRNAKVIYNDPYIPRVELGNKIYSSSALTAKLLKGMDCLIIITPHTKYNYPEIIRNSKLVFDTRGVTKGLKSKNIVRL